MVAVRRPVLALLLVVALVAAGLAGLVAVAQVRAGAAGDRCDRYAAQSRARAALVTGAGARVVVIGDSWSAGLGLDHPADSWASRLPGSVHVAGFSGSGFSEDASSCAGVSFADRAPAALRGGADLVVVEGGLNDWDQPAVAVRAGFRALVRELRAAGVAGRTVVVGPATAPSRAVGVPRVDALLAGLAARHGLPYVDPSSLELPYLRDELHLTVAGHRAFGDWVAAHVATHVATRPEEPGAGRITAARS
jgi:acyl-CoA thioesterase-1